MSASTAPTWSAWAFCRCNSSPEKPRSRSGLTGEEIIEISGVNELVRKFAPGKQVKVRAGQKEFNALVRIDTPQEAQYYANGGILQFVLRQLIASKPTAVHA